MTAALDIYIGDHIAVNGETYAVLDVHTHAGVREIVAISRNLVISNIPANDATITHTDDAELPTVFLAFDFEKGDLVKVRGGIQIWTVAATPTSHGLVHLVNGSGTTMKIDAAYLVRAED